MLNTENGKVQMGTPERVALLVVVLGVCVGCGGGDVPDLGAVRGTVLLDGEPLVGVNVIFHPEKGRAAVAMTDEEGRYELTYSSGNKGALLGPADVDLMWPTGASGPAIPEVELKVVVKETDNVFDFNLESP